MRFSKTAVAASLLASASASHIALQERAPNDASLAPASLLEGTETATIDPVTLQPLFPRAEANQKASQAPAAPAAPAASAAGQKPADNKGGQAGQKDNWGRPWGDPHWGQQWNNNYPPPYGYTTIPGQQGYVPIINGQPAYINGQPQIIGQPQVIGGAQPVFWSAGNSLTEFGRTTFLVALGATIFASTFCLL